MFHRLTLAQLPALAAMAVEPATMLVGQFLVGLLPIMVALALAIPDPVLAATLSARGDGLAVPCITIPRIDRAVTIDEFVSALTDSNFSSPLCHVHELVQRGPVAGAPVSATTSVRCRRSATWPSASRRVAPTSSR